MSKFELLILGSNSATPAYGRYPTSQVLTIGNSSLLIDCGEGSQIRMGEYKVKRNQIKHVLISHLHGDHLYGLPGFIGSLAHTSRKLPLIIFGPVGIKEYLETVLRLSRSIISFDLEVHEIAVENPHQIIDAPGYTVQAFPVNHRIPTYGYLFKEKIKDFNIRKEAIKEYGLSIDEIKTVKATGQLTRDGKTLEGALLVLPRAPERSYAYCADSQVNGWDKSHLYGVNTLYFESTYLHELQRQAQERGHATAKEAGRLAMELGVKKLVIGHYSSRYRSIDALLQEAQQEFKSTVAGYDGLILQI